ncbi:Hypothetical predicted protein, partial [Paramuricea clavata]
MSLKCTVALVLIICLSCKVVITDCEVVLVNRNVADSFRVGKDGCTNDTSVCTDFATACRQSDGLCLCPVGQPNFRKPTSAKDYGCLNSESIRLGAVKALAKFPDNPSDIDLQWLDESYVDLAVANETLNFKWKRSVPTLQGSIITLSLFCTLGSSSSTTKCLRAKVLGTWPADAVSTPTEQTVTSSQPKSYQITTKTTLPVTVITGITTEPKSTASASSDKDCSNSNVSNKIFIALFSVSLVVNVVLGIIVGFLCLLFHKSSMSYSVSLVLCISFFLHLFIKSTPSAICNYLLVNIFIVFGMQDKNLKIQNIDGQRRATTGNDIGAYDEVVTKSGIHNDVISDKSFPTSRHNNNEHLSGHNYEEPSNYEPLRKNPLQDKDDEHNYQ